MSNQADGIQGSGVRSEETSAADLGAESAFPHSDLSDDCIHTGLTKREQFAAMAMQSLAASWDGHNYGLAQRCVELADALLVALAKESQS